MDPIVLTVFALVYLGMLLGRMPGLALDRTGIALLGAIALLAAGRVGLDEAWQAIDVPTIALLLALMVVSAQFRLGGFYTAVTDSLAKMDVGPAALLGGLIAVSGALAAVLANDIVCLAMTPVLIEGCIRRRLNPLPYLLGLACAANVGSAATLIGNPQNMLIGQVLELSFAWYMLQAVVPAALGCLIVWAVISVMFRRHWHLELPMPTIARPAFDRWQTIKGVVIVVIIVVLFIVAPWPRELIALAGAGILLMSRRMASEQMLGLVDWHLLLLFIGLFIVNHTLAETGAFNEIAAGLRGVGIDPEAPFWLFIMATVLSNLVSNVPAVMFLLPFASDPMAGPVLAISSTLAGNLIIVGSIANIIVIDQARRLGVPINWRQHARVGVPVTILTLLVAALWLCGWTVLVGV